MMNVDCENISIDNRDDILQSLNFSRQKSEKDIKQMISQRDICHDIRNMIFNTINVSHQQVDAQKKMISELKNENKLLKKKVKDMKKEVHKCQSNERGLCVQINDQQKVVYFFG